jgi:uncharacterized protein YjbI with pentapeptide repeats
MKAIIPPRLPRDLRTVDDLLGLLNADGSTSGFIAIRQQLPGVHVKAAGIAEAKLEKLIATEAGLERIGLSDAVMTHSDLTAANCAEASWQRVRLTNTRCSGLKLHMSVLKDVIFEDCKLDLSNFRFSKLRGVSFKNCILDEADFYNAEIENVSFQNCSLQKAEFSAAKCKNVDLRTSDIANVRGIEGLAGATIDSVQLMTLSHTLAAYLKLDVNDE